MSKTAWQRNVVSLLRHCMRNRADSSEAPKQHDKGSTFTLFKPGNNIYVGGKEAVMKVNLIHLQDNTIQRSCWKSYKKILKSLGEMANRKSCQVCGRAMIRMPNVEAKDWRKQVRLAPSSAGSFPDKRPRLGYLARRPFIVVAWHCENRPLQHGPSTFQICKIQQKSMR